MTGRLRQTRGAPPVYRRDYDALGVCAAERFFKETVVKSGMNRTCRASFSSEKVCSSMISILNVGNILCDFLRRANS